MQVHVYHDSIATGTAAAENAAALIKHAINTNGVANIILATGTSQFNILQHLAADATVEWSYVNMFHLDEYIGLPVAHVASFRKYLKERFLDLVPPLKAVHLINGESDAASECQRLSLIISRHPIDAALVGIGENGHLAFNDPPADFDTQDPYIIVALDEACRQQQVNEGWFAAVPDVPSHAISMSVNQIMLSANIICTVPGMRKAIAVQQCLKQPVSNLFPASILQEHPNCAIYLDKDSASLL
ncbi:MAG TPA: glucosamine-6-phosphate deaminase [Panacibacter sp.]|mgnify:CR=1 FL=1|nr:glucosamine-6-phosphate deaminase [Panacibacter sp.]HNP43375.1 glucosamine-6-phosphate deaminase [Panacibacter sp.]